MKIKLLLKYLQNSKWLVLLIFNPSGFLNFCQRLFLYSFIEIFISLTEIIYLIIGVGQLQLFAIIYYPALESIYVLNN